MEIDLQELRIVIDRLFVHVIDTHGIQKVELSADMYWDMAPEVLYDPTRNPTTLDLGSLCDDWEFVSKLLDPHEKPLANQFTEVAPILRRLGEVLAEQLVEKGG